MHAQTTGTFENICNPRYTPTSYHFLRSTTTKLRYYRPSRTGDWQDRVAHLAARPSHLAARPSHLSYSGLHGLSLLPLYFTPLHPVNFQLFYLLTNRNNTGREVWEKIAPSPITNFVSKPNPFWLYVPNLNSIVSLASSRRWHFHDSKDTAEELKTHVLLSPFAIPFSDQYRAQLYLNYFNSLLAPLRKTRFGS